MKGFEAGVRYVRFLMTGQDVYRYVLGTSNEEVDSSIQTALEELNNDYRCLISNPRRVGKELIFTPKRFSDKVFLRHLNLQLRRKYKVKLPDRHEVVRQVIKLLKADSQLNIVRADISRFYSSINFESLVRRLRSDCLLDSFDVKGCESVLDHVKSTHARGLPWGLAISATLSEIYTRELDHVMRSMPGVYYYGRYVDDIIIFSAEPAREVVKKLESTTSSLGLKLNPLKTQCIAESGSNPASFSYLGYTFERSKVKYRQQNELAVRIAERKLTQLKKRIDLSFKDYYRNREWRLLENRIKLLSGNYFIWRSQHEVPIQVGISRNYAMITDNKQLEEIDAHFRKRVIALRVSVGRARRGDVLRPIYLGLVKKLMKYSFKEGFNRKVLHRYSISDLRKIVRAWKK